MRLERQNNIDGGVAKRMFVWFNKSVPLSSGICGSGREMLQQVLYRNLAINDLMGIQQRNERNRSFREK